MEPIQKTTNVDGTLTLDLVDNSLEAFFNSLPVYYFKKEFTSTNSPFLQRFYKVTLDDDSHFEAIFDRSEIEYVEVLRTPEPLYIPNDYQALFGTPLSQLDLIKIPFAWNITHGNPNFYGCIIETYVESNHEDLTNQIAQYLGSSGTGTHGTAVAGALAAQTDNNIGIAASGFNTKLIILGGNPIYNNEILDMADIPGVKVINYSRGNCDYSPGADEFWRVVWEENSIVVVCGAGNANQTSSCSGDPEEYFYPASFDHTISVTSVGHIFPLGTNDLILGRSNWKDVHEKLSVTQPQRISIMTKLT